MSLIEELKRRNVIRVGAAYVIIAWLIAQVADLALDNFDAPAWVIKTILMLLALGFPLAIFFAWAFELTPEGIKKEKDVNRDESITPNTGRKLDYTIIGVLAVALIYFIWESRIADDGVDAAASSQQQAAGEGAASANEAASGNYSVAVLPFANRSKLDDDLFFTDGIHDDILTQLAKIQNLKIISRTSVMQYRDTDKPIAQIAEELGVSTILEGGVQRAGERIRINAQLIDAATDQHLWAETYDKQMTIENLFDIQSEITGHIVEAIKGKLSPDEKRILDDKPTNSLAAWEAYARARQYVLGSGFDPDAYREAEPLLQKAVELDPNFYAAHAMLVNVHGAAYWISYDQTDARKQMATDSLARAASLAPNSAETLNARGVYLYRFERDYEGAIKAQKKALKVKPGDGQIKFWMGLAQRRLGLWDEAIDNFLSAYEADPGNLSAIATALETISRMGDAERLRKYLVPALARFPDSSDLGSIAVNFALWETGDVAKAKELYAKVMPNSASAYMWASRDVAWLSRDPSAVIKAWERPELLRYLQADVVATAGFRELDLAWAYRLKGDSEQAKKWLDIAVEATTSLSGIKDENSRSYAWATRVQALALRGASEAAIKEARDLMAFYPIAGDRMEAPYMHVSAARALALAGEHDEALEILERLSDTAAAEPRWFLYLDPRWDFFRDDERFNALAKPHNLDEATYTRPELKR